MKRKGLEVFVEPEFWDEKATASYLLSSPKTLQKHRLLGIGLRYHKINGRVLYRISDVKAAVSAGCIEPRVG